MNTKTERELTAIARELVNRRNLWLMLAILLSAVLLTIGLVLPKKYSSYASIVVEDHNIIGPLMEGMAEQTDVSTIAKIVREMAFSRALLDQIMEAGGFINSGMSASQREQVRAEIIERTEINQRRDNLIGIQYTDETPERAELVTRMYVDYVLTRSEQQQQEESQKAFGFINAQVHDYHQKLLDAEERLQAYRSSHLDALPESATDVRTYASKLRQQIEDITLELSSLRVQEQQLRAQLSGEAELTKALEREMELRARKDRLDKQLNNLRLSYHDTYPDIVRLKNQIEEIDDELETLGPSGYSSLVNQLPRSRRDDDGNMIVQLNSLYEDLRRQLSETETDIATRTSRKRELEALLEEETRRGGRIADTEARLAEMSRDYEVNKDIYSDLLRRRENARLSMLIDEQQGGLKLRLQEPPALPQAPSGLRFMHVAAVSVLMVLALPFALSTAMVKVDPRIRSREQIEDLSMPVLSVIPDTPDDSRGKKIRDRAVFFLGCVVLIGLYVAPAVFLLSNQMK